MGKILVPVDFSEHSAYALEVAASMARHSGSEIVLLHMMGLSEAVLTKDAAQEAAEAHYYMKLTRKRFQEFLDKDFLKGIRVHEMVQNYKIFSEINEVAFEVQAELIVMGSHGTGGLSSIFVGSNTEKVVRTAQVPVLVLKKQRPGYLPHRVVYACDYKLENLKGYTQALKFFEQWKTEIHLVYVNLPTEHFKSSEEIERERELFFKVAHNGKQPPGINTHVVSDYSIEGGIFYFASLIEADLIAMPTHGRRGMAHFFKGSIGEDVANRAEIPVITFKV
ncbi:universal stress protein [Lentiprolixibacter aurantiacus]|uniref:Universal stress protein n=1 Tax=Lentiprolixibacter aurantiacus TaxID=2993939 RepID=A0AAE3MLN7_9FLAO|nr:universal stress protein [Lentiprolixibacter aurantiacus]MCX2720115.1 universal stress protein [Lentiprolixibacter aurantiacus]